MIEPPKEGDPNGNVLKAIENLRKLEPSPLASPARASLIQPANYGQHLAELKECDLVIEAISERMDWKADLYRKVAPHLAPDAIFASNTSGLSINKLADAFPDAWIEDPALTDETDRVLEPHRDRITWDAPIHSVADIDALPFPPRMVNIKPSRFGRLRELFDAYDYCDEHGIGAYGGGQFELGVGRGHIQYLASLFHPDTPNDVAPGDYNAPEPPPGLPTSPLEPQVAPVGFRWGP